MRGERRHQITMKQETDRMANAASGTKWNTDEFEKTKRIVRPRVRIHESK